MMVHRLGGVYAAAVTPLKDDLSPDLEGIPPLLDFLARRGCRGALILGTTGEGPSFAPDERLDIYRAALQVRVEHPSFHLLAGTGTPSLSETAALTRASFELGYEGAVVLPPFYFRKVTEDGLFAYFSELIRRAVPSDGALLYYHFPSLTGITITVEFLSRLRDAFPHQFIGIKDSSGDAETARAIGEQFGHEFLNFVGNEKLFQWGLENHASGCITAPANLLSPDLARLWQAYQEGGELAKLQTRLTDQRQVLERSSPFPPIIKALLACSYGLPQWAVRPPLLPVSDETAQSVRAALKAVGEP
jgi:4-hydroxy-tetrahydrodipicolinate synthase